MSIEKAEIILLSKQPVDKNYMASLVLMLTKFTTETQKLLNDAFMQLDSDKRRVQKNITEVVSTILSNFKRNSLSFPEVICILPLSYNVDMALAYVYLNYRLSPPYQKHVGFPQAELLADLTHEWHFHKAP